MDAHSRMTVAPIAVAIALSAIGVFADYQLKRASLASATFNPWLLFGTLTYASTAIGWMYVFRHLTFAQVGVVYCTSTILLLVAAGTLFFQESLKPLEIIGVALALASIVLLNRFA